MDKKLFKTILLVENDSDTAAALIHRIEGSGCRFIHAESGSRAIDIINGGNDTIDLVLMDIDPGEGTDGADTAGIIIESHNLPVIFMHSGENNPALLKTGQIASYGYINKNSDDVILALSINAALKRSDIQKESETNKNEELRLFDEKFRLFAASLNDGIFIIDTNGRFTYVSPVIERMSGYARCDITGRLFHEFIHPDDLDGLINSFRKTVAGEIEAYECRILDRTGNIIHIRTSSGLLFNNGELTGLMGVLVDITNSKQDEEKIRNLLSEKELILKEVHHRVKNNMNTIFALLRLQADENNNPETESILLDAAGRVHSMSILYDRLYRSDIKGQISLKDYLPQLINEIIRIFPGGESVNVIIHVDDIILKPERLSTVGIILNEFITNTMKFGINNDGSSVISLTVTKKGAIASIVYEDNGPGIPDSDNIEQSGGFGMQLIAMLVDQMKGSKRVERSGHLKFIIEFPLS